MSWWDYPTNRDPVNCDSGIVRLNLVQGNPARVISEISGRFLAWRRQILSVAKNEPWQFESARKARDENARLRTKAEQPAEIKAISPIWNCDLVAGEKSKRSADAMDRRPIG